MEDEDDDEVLSVKTIVRWPRLWVSKRTAAQGVCCRSFLERDGPRLVWTGCWRKSQHYHYWCNGAWERQWQSVISSHLAESRRHWTASLSSSVNSTLPSAALSGPSSALPSGNSNKWAGHRRPRLMSSTAFDLGVAKFYFTESPSLRQTISAYCALFCSSTVSISQWVLYDSWYLLVITKIAVLNFQSCPMLRGNTSLPAHRQWL